jgi:hypothetical protein
MDLNFHIRLKKYFVKILFYKKKLKDLLCKEDFKLQRIYKFKKQKWQFLIFTTIYLIKKILLFQKFSKL